MTSKKMDFGSGDLISSLPDEILCHILSFLSTKDAALTSVLSRRWRNLLAFVPILDLDNRIYDRPNMDSQKMVQLRICFMAFVDRILALQGNAPLIKFSLKCKIGSNPSLVNGWILSVLQRGVVELDLFIVSVYKYPLPPMVFMNKTLVSLKVAGTIQFSIQVGEVFLPKLKTLHFNNVMFEDASGVAFAKLISSCHALEEFVMIQNTRYLWESYSVSNRTLKRIRIDFKSIYQRPKSVSFDTPNLLYLELTDTVAATYPKANFGTLVEASLGIRMAPDLVFERYLVNPYYQRFEGRSAADLLTGICNVKTMYLSSEALEVLTYFSEKAIPVFNNLIHLTMETHQELDWESLPKLLKNCPNLETVVFEGLHYKNTNQCFDKDYSFKDTNKCFDYDLCLCKPWCGTPVWLSSSPVKILKVLKFGEISSFKDDFERQMDLIEHFLETMSNLEQVILYYDTPSDVDLKAVSTQLRMLKRVASNKCNIQVISDSISYSTTLYSSSSTNGPVFFNNTFPV